VCADRTTPLLTGRNLLLIRGDRALFSELEFDLGRGELLQVEGANGSGKTSLLRVIAGLTPPQEGVVRWRECDVSRKRQALHGEMAWVGHRPGFKADLTLSENLRFEAGLRRRAARAPDETLARLGLTSLMRLPFRVLSAGQQRRAGLARLLLADATLWLLDEPLTNLDLAGQGLVAELLDAHLADGGLAIVASHRDLGVSAVVNRLRLS
jgi:heme exporter protein A